MPPPARTAPRPLASATSGHDVPADSVAARAMDLMASHDQAGAATAVIAGYGPQVLRYLRGLLGDSSLAEEAFAAFAEDVWRGLPGYRGEGPLRAWVFRIGWGAARDLRGEAWRRRARPLTSSIAARLAQHVTSATPRRTEARRQALDELRGELSLEDQCLLRLHLEDGLSFESCALVLSRPDAPVKAATLAKRFERSKAKLGRLARRRGLLRPWGTEPR